MNSHIGQPLYYYNHDPQNDMSRHFPHPQHMQQMMNPMVHSLPTTPIYSRPGSASTPHPPTLFSNGTAIMTPSASPQLVSQKPAIVLNSELHESSYFPSTPPLSTSGSTIGSPDACDVLQTPMNPMFSGLDGLDSFKSGPESAETSIFDWSSCGSPPMTPVYLQSQIGQAPSLCNTASDLSSTPSLSPSPPPYCRSINASDHGVDFCDPRKLTVVSSVPNSTIASESPIVGAGSRVRIGSTDLVSANVASQSLELNNPALSQGLSTLEDFSDFESEDDFVNSLVSIGNESTSDVSRPRACTASSVVSLGHGSFIADSDLSFDEQENFQFSTLSSPSTMYEDSHQDKRKKMAHTDDCNSVPVMNAAASTTQSGDAPEPSFQVVQAASEPNTSSGSDSAPARTSAPANRRGRKQSLTEDPSKTFVCDLCNRRFRRQEHLKRHYRSLHTQEKPFECNECGKKFSRSDNLAQHARTHGSGAIVMNLIDENDPHAYGNPMMAQSMADNFNAYGKVLFQLASEVPGSSSEISDDASQQVKKKRKRSD